MVHAAGRFSQRRRVTRSSRRRRSFFTSPTATTTSTFAQGAALGGARFRRLEGCWWGDRTGFFLSTDGGSQREGQVFEYDPRNETIELIYDAPTFADCDNPDNMTVTPRGGLLLCEDNAGGQGPVPAGERLLGLTLHGSIFTFAINNVVLTSARNPRVPAGDYRQNEWAGACYSPDGKWLFANIQTPGITFAITGPWGAGPLYASRSSRRREVGRATAPGPPRPVGLSKRPG